MMFLERAEKKTWNKKTCYLSLIRLLDPVKTDAGFIVKVASPVWPDFVRPDLILKF